MLDLDGLSAICDGDDSLINEFIKTFLQTTRDDIQHLEKAIDQRQTKEISDLAHRIKGGAAIVGASQLHRLVEDLERSPGQCLTENNTLFREVIDSLKAIEKLYPGL